MIQLDPSRVSRLLSPDARLRSGSGSGINGKFDACIMQAVDWLAGGAGESDSPECADHAITRFCIRLNDATRFAEWRDELKPFAVRVVGTRSVDPTVLQRRGYMSADWAVREVAPKAFDFYAELRPAKREQYEAWAAKLRGVAPIVDKETAHAAHAGMNEVRAAAYAAAAAYAVAVAYAAGSAASYAAEYAATAAYAVEYEAEYAATAARPRAKAFSRELWEMSLAHLDRMIRVTEA